jgi:hypothetical protein
MRLRRRRLRNIVVWSSAGGVAIGRASVRRRRVGLARRLIYSGRVLTVVGLLWVVRVIRPRWRPVLAGVVCTAAGLILRDTAWSGILLVGLLLLVYSVFIPAPPDDERRRLAREVGSYSTRAQRRDLEALLDKYPDTVTRDLREILARAPERAGG